MIVDEPRPLRTRIRWWVAKQLDCLSRRTCWADLVSFALGDRRSPWQPIRPECRRDAAANGYWVGAINRPGWEDPWRIGEFYGQSYFCDPRGQIIAEGSRDKDELVIADLDMEKIREVRNTWQFFRDRRPDLYGPIIDD